MKIGTRQRELLNRLTLHSMDNPHALGLLYGQMGIVTVMAQCVRQWNIPELESAADFLFSNISANTGRVYDIGFANGLSGICWGVEYLVQYDIMPGPADDICRDTDRRIMQTDIRRVSDFGLYAGLRGIWQYVKARIQGNMTAGLPLPFDKSYLSDWLGVLRNNPDFFADEDVLWLQSALQRHLNAYRLSLIPFIHRKKVCPDTDLSLSEGIAGYIATHYLTEV